MPDIAEIRRQNLRRLVNEHEGMNNLARKLGFTKGAYISQLLTTPPLRQISEKTARKWEKQLGLRTGWLDGSTQPPVTAVDATPFDPALLERVIAGVLSELDDQAVKLRPARVAELIIMQYTDAKALRSFDPARLRKMVRLIKR